MYSASKLNKQGDYVQSWYIPFPTWNQSVVPCPVLTVASWPAYKFLKRQVRWSGFPISLRIFHSLLWSTQATTLAVNKAEEGVFLEFSCFFYKPMLLFSHYAMSNFFATASLLHPWGFPDKDTGVGCYLLFQGPRDRTWVSCIPGRRFNLWATREALSLYLKSS